MKITITKFELLTILSAHFNQSITECTISKEMVPCKIEVLLAKELKIPVITTGSISGPNFIAAIKALRTVVTECNLGLADAKWAIENWPRWIEFVRKHGRIPILKTTEGTAKQPAQASDLFFHPVTLV